MVISHNSQLGLRFKEIEVKCTFLKAMMKINEDLAGGYKLISDAIEAAPKREDGSISIEIPDEVQHLLLSNANVNDVESLIEKASDERRVRDIASAALGTNTLTDDDGFYYFICESVYKAAELIKIGDRFTGRTLKDIKFGRYTYLMGRNKMVRFYVGVGAIKGFYFNDKDNIAFEWGLEMEDGGYYFDGDYSKEFSMIMQVLSFVELGDIEVRMLEAGRNNGGKKNVDKITNTSNKTVYVVDSSWNQIVIRTTGFAVRGHFKLQPCGEGSRDRKLIWVSAFEKHGYTRRPTGEIAR